MTSVEALLRLPTDEIKSSLPTVTDEDASLVLREMETVLRKCLYAVRYTLTAPFSVFLHILSQPVISESTNIAEVLLAPVEEGRCLDLVVDVCSTLLRPEHHAFRGSVNVEGFFEMIQQLCASAALKDSFGAVIMPCLLTFLNFAVEKEDDYRQARACASLLITLIRGSKANKNRMSVECGHIGGALTKSSDIFFQMQCVEILFRLYTHNRTVLATSTLPEFFKKGVAELPNDANLLTSIQTLLDAYNMEHRTFDLIQFTALLIEAGKEEVCGHTALYFSPLILVIMIPGYSGDNITIPYEHIRSVKLSKERKLALRLHVIPVRLSHAMNTAEGKDTLMISLTQSTFSAIRSSGVHEWIAERKRRVPASRLRQQMEILSASSSSSSVRAEMLSSQNRHLKDAEYVEGESEHFVRASAANQATKTAPSLNHGVSIEEEKKKKKPKVSSKPTSPNRKAQPIPKQQQEEEEEAAGEAEGNALRQLHEAASFKVERMRQDNQRKLQCAVDFMQEEIEKMRRLNARERDDFEASVREDLTSVRRAEVQVKARATECIQSLNQELKEIQALSEVLRSEVKNVRENLRTVLQDTESLEEESLVQLKATVDEDMKSMEETLVHLMSSTNPLSFLAKYLSRKLDTTEA